MFPFQIKFITKIGGDDGKDAIARALKACFCNDLAAKCTWQGRKENIAVNSLNVMKIIKGMCPKNNIYTS